MCLSEAWTCTFQIKNFFLKCDVTYTLIVAENNSSQEPNARFPSQSRHSSTVFIEIEHIA